MRRVVAIGVLALVGPAGPASADGCPPAQCGLLGAAEPGSRYVSLRTAGERGPLRLFDVVTRTQRVSLPPGIASANGRRFVSARATATETTITRYALPAGSVLTRQTIRGRYGLEGVSRTGRRIVLRALRRGPQRATRFEIRDGARLVRRVTLRGGYELETLSPDGRRLFLVHWRRSGYDLRLFDLATRRLRATPTFEPNGEQEKMVGTAWRGIVTRDGRWLLTLYVEGDGGFVHALDLRRGIGHCVDLLEHGNAAALGSSALAVSPDQRRLYVASPVLGRVFTIDLRRPRVTRVARFEPWLGLDEVGFGSPSAAVSRNGRTLYFNGNGLLWAYDSTFGRVRGPYPARRLVTTLGFTPDDRRVVAFGGDGRATVLDAATGRRLSRG